MTTFFFGEIKPQESDLFHITKSGGLVGIKGNGERYHCNENVVPVSENTPEDRFSEALEEYNKTLLLQRDPIELFKEDRQPWYTASSIKMMRFLNIKTVEQLASMSPQELHRLTLNRHMSVGKKTIAYIDHCLRRHGLSLRQS